MRGRIRQLKPELFLDDEFWALQKENPDLPLFQAFLGLWCFADREGRFEWRIMPLKSQILPYWEGDFGAVLDALAESRLIIRYAVAGRCYGAIRSFGKHQMPNNRESPSVIPAPGADASHDVDDTHPGFVYVAALPDGSAFKVGFSRKDPLKRVNDISNGSPEPLRLVEFIEGGTTLEASIHRALKPHNRHREWFSANDDSVTVLGEWFSRDPRVTHPCPSRAHASSYAAPPAYNQTPTPTPTPNPGPDSQPRSAEVFRSDQSRPARALTLPSETPTPEFIDAAVMAGVSPAQATSTWEHYWGAGLPDRGVEKLIPWMVKRAKERANATARAGPRRSDPEDRLQKQADRVRMLREQEAEDERRAGGVSS